MDYYGDDTWISSAVSFNPYQCELVPLQVMYSVSVCTANLCGIHSIVIVSAT